MLFNEDWSDLTHCGKIVVAAILTLGLLAIVQVVGEATGHLCLADVFGGSHPKARRFWCYHCQPETETWCIRGSQGISCLPIRPIIN